MYFSIWFNQAILGLRKLNRATIIFMYCESIVVRWVPIFVEFVGLVNHGIWFPTKRKFSICMYDGVVESTNSRIHELIIFPLTTKIGIHE